MPIALVGWIVLHRGLPLTILLVIPIVGLLGLLVDDSLLVSPIIGFGVLGVIDLLGCQHLPIFLDGSLIDLLFVNLHPNCSVRLHDQPVEVRSAFPLLLVCQVCLLQDVLALVIEDQMCSFGVPALVWA